jgi:hypothetical protein
MTTKAQRRNRRKPRTVSDHALLTLHKYYLRAEYMRGQCYDARDRLVANHGPEALKIRTPSTERFQVEMYLDYWYAGLFAAMEGYEKLALNDPFVEKLRADPLFTKFRAHRMGTYHFREKYFDDSIREFLEAPHSSTWMMTLHMRLGYFLLAELDKMKQRRARDEKNTTDASAG